MCVYLSLCLKNCWYCSAATGRSTLLKSALTTLQPWSRCRTTPRVEVPQPGWRIRGYADATPSRVLRIPAVCVCFISSIKPRTCGGHRRGLESLHGSRISPPDWGMLRTDFSGGVTCSWTYDTYLRTGGMIWAAMQVADFCRPARTTVVP